MLKIKSLYRINGIFYILFGLFLFLKPELSLKLIIIITSIEIIIFWILWIIIDLATTTYSNRKNLCLFSVFQIIFWILLLLFPEIGEFIAALFVVIIGIICFIKGIFMCIDSFKVKKANISTRRILLLCGIIAILLWIFLTTNAFLELIIINILVGLWMILYWIQMIIFWFQAKRKIIKGIEDELEEIDDIEDLEDE